MNNEKRKILKVNLKQKESKLSLLFNHISENICRLYFDIINGTIENLWLHCAGMVIEYVNLLSYTLYPNVSLIYFL